MQSIGTQQRPDVELLVKQINQEGSILGRMHLLVRLQELTDAKTHQELADLIGKSASFVWTSMVLTSLTAKVLELVETGDEAGRKLPVSTAQAIARLPTDQQLPMALRVLNEGISAHRLKEMLSGGLTATASPDEARAPSVETSDADALKTIIHVLVENDQRFLDIRRISWEEFSAAFKSVEELQSVKRLLGYLSIRVCELDEMLAVVQRIKFSK